MRFVVDIGYPADLYEELDDTLDDVATQHGGKWTSSGMGWGVRDIQFEIHGRRPCTELVMALKEVLDTVDKKEIEPDGYEAPYIGCDWEPKSLVLCHLRNHEYKEALTYLWRDWREDRAWQRSSSK